VHRLALLILAAVVASQSTGGFAPESEARRLEETFDNVVSSLSQYENIFEIAEEFRPRGRFGFELVIVQVGVRPAENGRVVRLELQYWIGENGLEVSGFRRIEKPLTLSTTEVGGFLEAHARTSKGRATAPLTTSAGRLPP
jgi:hypothetical protein